MQFENQLGNCTIEYAASWSDQSLPWEACRRAMCRLWILNLLGLLAGMLWTFVLRAVLRLPYEARMFKEARPE
jgi:hypothetical protein